MWFAQRPPTPFSLHGYYVSLHGYYATSIGPRLAQFQRMWELGLGVRSEHRQPVQPYPSPHHPTLSDLHKTRRIDPRLSPGGLWGMSHTSHSGVLKLLTFWQQCALLCTSRAQRFAFFGTKLFWHSLPSTSHEHWLFADESGLWESTKRTVGEKNPRRKLVAMRYTLVLKAIPIARLSMVLYRHCLIQFLSGFHRGITSYRDKPNFCILFRRAIVSQPLNRRHFRSQRTESEVA